jgi:hypothetical protein
MELAIRYSGFQALRGLKVAAKDGRRMKPNPLAPGRDIRSSRGSLVAGSVPTQARRATRDV